MVSEVMSLLKFLYSEKATKFCKISCLLLSYVVPVKSKVDISQNFVAFSEYMSFMKKVCALSFVFLLQRIMELAENLALDHDYDKELGKRLKDPPQSGGYHYVNAKKLNLKDPEEEEDGSPDFEKYYSVDRSVDDPKFMVGYSRLNLEANKYLL